jgi:hypothetical protein
MVLGTADIAQAVDGEAFVDNTADIDGGGLWCAGAEVALSAPGAPLIFTSNEAGQTGGTMAVTAGCNVEAEYVRWEHGSASDGAGIDLVAEPAGGVFPLKDLDAVIRTNAPAAPPPGPRDAGAFEHFDELMN